MKKIIDVSQHNGTINFNKVKESGIEGVIIRIGWIGNKENHTLDTKFVENVRKCQNVGLPIGIYVYNYCVRKDTVESGTRWVIKKIREYNFQNIISYPIFIDMEDSTISGLSKNLLTDQCLTFCNIVKNYGFKAGIYANKNWFLNKLEINKLLDYKIWLAEWNGRNNHTLGYKVDLCQYSSNGQVPGISGRVDMNYCLCECDNIKPIENKPIKKEEFEMAKTYRNGSTIEMVYSDSSLKNAIGNLNKYETCECLGIVNGRYIVKYKIDGTSNYKVGFVKYSGGVK